MANNIQNKTATIYIDDAPAIDAYNRLIPKADAYNKKIDEGTKKAAFLEKAIKKSLDAGGSPERLQKQLTAVNATLDKNRQGLEKVITQQKALQQQIDSKSGPSLRQQEALVRKLRNEYSNLGQNTEAAKKKLIEFSDASKSLDKMKEKLSAISSVQKESSGGFMKVLGTVAEFSGAYALIQKGSELVHNFFEGSIEEADAAQEAVDGLKVALENAGRSDLLQPLLDQADEFAAKYKRLDNDDITGVFTKLVDYGKLTKKQINEVTDVIINYAAKQKITLAESTDVITKALEGSAKGLKIYGVNLSEAKTVTERYGIVVNELGKKVQGAEAAFEQTNQGMRAGFLQTIKNAQESVGKFLYSLVGLGDQSQRNAVAAKHEAEQGTVLVARYEELSKKVNKTSADKAELTSITNRLVGMFGTSVVSINKETGALTLNVNATKDLIKQKLLLANSKASELALKFNAAQEEEVAQIENQKKLLPALIELQKKTGKTFAEIQDMQTGGSAGARKVADNPLYRQIYDLGIQLETFAKSKKRASKDILSLMDDLKELGVSAKDVNKLLNPEAVDPNAIIGGGDPNANTAGDKTAESKAEAARKKRLEDEKKFQEQLRKFKSDYSVLNQSDEDKEMEAAVEKYNALVELANGNSFKLQQAETALQDALLQIRLKYARKGLEAAEKFDEERKKQIEEFAKTAVAAGAAALKKFEDNLNDGIKKSAEEKLQHLQTVIDTSPDGSFKKLKAQHTIIDDNHNNEIAQIEAEKKRRLAEAKNEQDIQNIKDKARVLEADADARWKEARMDSDRAFYTALAGIALNFAQQIADITSLDNQAQTNKENAELAKLQKKNDKEKAAHQKLLNGKLISQQEYNRRAKTLDDQYRNQEAAAKKKQWERQQKADIQGAIISGAQSILSALQTKPFLLGLLLAGVAAIKTKKQIDVIKSQPAPEFGKGGQLNGPSHKEGGMPVINPRTGRKEAEVEGGEVILSKKTVRNNSALVGALLQSSLHNGGATIKPWVKLRPYQTIDFAGITQSIQKVRHFENGGTFDVPATESTAAPQTVIVPSMSEQQEQLLQAVLKQLQTPPKAFVVYSEIEAAGDQLNQIKEDARFK